jgi:hypothetical protein
MHDDANARGHALSGSERTVDKLDEDLSFGAKQ